MGDWNRHKKKKPSIVVYDNNYVEALYQADYLAKKIMITASLCCQEMDWTERGCEVVISSNELRDISGVARNSLKHLEHAVDKLHETKIRIRNLDDPTRWESFVYLPYGKYEQGTLTLRISPEMKPFIQDLQKNFTQYHIENIKPLKSGYSIRIFELLKMSAYKGKYRIKLNELRKMFGLENKYKNYYDFTKYVIEPAKRELKEYCEIYFEYREIKTGNKVTEVEFEIFKQKKEFSLPEEVIEAKANDIEFGNAIPKTSGLEIELNKLGWAGDFQELLKHVSKEAIQYYMKHLKLDLDDLDKSEMNPGSIHEYIENSLKNHAEQKYKLIKDAYTFPLPSQKKREKEHSELGKKLIKLGFSGAVEKYIEEEGRGVIEEVLKSIEGQPGITNAGGLLREKVKALKEQKNLIKAENNEKKQKVEREKIQAENLLNKKKQQEFDFLQSQTAAANKAFEKFLALSGSKKNSFIDKYNQAYCINGKYISKVEYKDGTLIPGIRASDVFGFKTFLSENLK